MLPDLTEEQACERLDSVVEAVLWSNDGFMHWLEVLARCCYDPTDGHPVDVRMTRLWYAYVRREIGEEEDCDCDVRRPNTPSRT